MSDAIARRHELPKLGQLARCCYQKHFRPERMLDDYMSLYKSHVFQKEALHSA